MDHWEVNPWPWAPAASGVVVGQLKHVASLLQALIHVQPPPERLLLLLQLSSDTPWAGDRLFFALGMENGSTTFTPVKANQVYDEQGWNEQDTNARSPVASLCSSGHILLQTTLTLGSGMTHRNELFPFPNVQGSISLDKLFFFFIPWLELAGEETFGLLVERSQQSTNNSVILVTLDRALEALCQFPLQRERRVLVILGWNDRKWGWRASPTENTLNTSDNPSITAMKTQLSTSVNMS